MRNVTLEDIREMRRGDDLPSSPTDPSAVHRSFVQEQQNEQLAIARNLRRSVNLPSSSSSSRRSFNLPSSSSSEEQSFHHEEKTGEEPTGRLKADEATPSASCTTKRKPEDEEESDQNEVEPVSPGYVRRPDSGWVLNDETYMAKVYENIRWR